MEISFNKGFNPTTLKPEEAKNIQDNHSTSDQVLDLSNQDTLANELQHQDLNAVKAIKIGDRFVQISPDELKSLVKNLQGKLLDGNHQLKADFNAIQFSEQTGISANFSDFTHQSVRDSMTQRAQARVNVQEPAEVKKALDEDLQLLSKSYQGGDVAVKVMLQDMAMLERKGLLKPEEKILYQQIMERMTHEFETKNHYGLSKSDQQALKAILERAAKDPMPAQLLQTDSGAVNKLGSPEAGTAEAQYQTASSNLPAAMAASDAAIHDLSSATREVGASLYSQQKAVAEGKKVNGIELGRSQARIQQSVQEATHQYDQIRDKLMPATAQQITALQKNIDQRSKELVWQACPELKGNDDPAKIKAYIDGHPEVKGKLDADPAIAKMRTARDEAVTQYRNLTSQMAMLGESRVEALKKMQGLTQLAKQEDTRVGAMQDMSATLDAGVNQLNMLQQQLTDLDKGLTSGTGGDPLEDVQRTKQEILALQTSLVTQMEQLIGVCKKQGSTDPQLLEALDLQLKSLKELTFDVPLHTEESQTRQACVAGISEMVESLQNIRHNTLAALQNSNNVSQQEKDTLKHLDTKVTGFTGASLDTENQVLDTTASIKTKIKMAEEETKQDSDKAMDFIKDLEGGDKPEGLEEEDHNPHVELAYDSHISAKLDGYVGAGVGLGGLAEAKVTGFFGAGVKIAKSFGQGPKYIVQVDVHAKIKAEATLLWVFHADASAQKALQAGLGFTSMEDVGKFNASLARVVELYARGDHDGPIFDAAYDDLVKQIHDHSYTGDATELQAGAGVGIPQANNTFDDKASARITHTDETNTFHMTENKQVVSKNITDKSTTEQLQVGEYKLKHVSQTSHVNTVNGKPVHVPDSSRHVVQLTLPPEILREAVHYGLSKIPPGMLEALFNNLGPNVGMSYEAFKTQFGSALEKIREKSGEAVERVVQLAEKYHVEASLGIEYVNEPGEKRYIAMEFGVAKEWDTGERDIAKGSIGVADFRAGYQAHAELEAAVAIPIATLTPEPGAEEKPGSAE